jgi:hypothetical protein
MLKRDFVFFSSSSWLMCPLYCSAPWHPGLLEGKGRSLGTLSWILALFIFLLSLVTYKGNPKMTQQIPAHLSGKFQ